MVARPSFFILTSGERHNSLCRVKDSKKARLSARRPAAELESFPQNFSKFLFLLKNRIYTDVENIMFSKYLFAISNNRVSGIFAAKRLQWLAVVERSEPTETTPRTKGARNWRHDPVTSSCDISNKFLLFDKFHKRVYHFPFWEI